MNFNNAAVEVRPWKCTDGGLQEGTQAAYITGTLKRRLADEEVDSLPNGDAVRPAVERTTDTKIVESLVTAGNFGEHTYKLWVPGAGESVEFVAVITKISAKVKSGVVDLSWNFTAWIPSTGLGILSRVTGKDKAALLDAEPLVEMEVVEVPDDVATEESDE